MSQTVITQAFEELKAQEAANGGVLTLDEFVFASVPNLNITDPIDRTEGLPPAAQIVHRQAVSKTGMVNGNAVVYSVVLGADVGDFEFNWVGLLNKASGVVAMIVHAPSQKKIRTQSGQQGNVLTRSFLMEYNGASEQTQIITPADTWQIDFTARLNGVDERIRLENRDTYGPASFLKDGFLVAGANGNYQVKKGVAYIEGLRAELQFDQALAVAVRPSKIWLDVCWRGTLTSVWATATRLTVADNLSNYVEGDEQHYVFAIADILADGSVIDLRRNTPLAQVMELSAEPNTVPYFDKDTKLKMFAYQETPHVSPEMYGAKETISAADTQAIIDAFATAKAMGVGLKLSRLYKCAGNITLTSFIS
ncbi:TPA: phage tail protein, partial [Enterobacter hormaechei]